MGHFSGCHGKGNTVMNAALHVNAAPLFASFTFSGSGNQSLFSCKWNVHVRPGRRSAAGIQSTKCEKGCKLHARHVCPPCWSGTQLLPPPTTHRPDTLPPSVQESCAVLGGATLDNSPGLLAARDPDSRLQWTARCWARFKIEHRTLERDQNMLYFRVDLAQSQWKG